VATSYLVAPDSFKGTFTAAEVAAAIGRGLGSGGATADLCPLADGGEGTMDVLLGALGGEPVELSAHDPLGRKVEAAYGRLGDGRGVVEVAQASGLGLVSEGERDAERASSGGTGELILAAIDAGAQRVWVAAGGSATTDGGLGAIDVIRDAGGLGGAGLVVLCDVMTPFERAAEVFAPQKGADPEAVQRLSTRLGDLAASLPRDPRGVPMSGAAGGLAGGLWAALGAELRSGAQAVMEAVGFERRLSLASAVVSGEGRLDAQSVAGKVVGEVAERCRRANVPLDVIAGSLEEGFDGKAAMGARSVTAASTLAELEAAGAALAGNRPA
jgi:glycerate 2-kinase